MKVWITKYALTDGEPSIVEATHYSDHLSGVPEGKYVRVEKFNGLIAKPHWHTTEKEAHAQIIKMVKAARVSIEKQLKKLKALEEKYSDLS